MCVSGLLSEAVQSAAAEEKKLRLIAAWELIAYILMPSLTKSACNAFLSSQLWSVISLLPFELRYDAYDAWLGKGTRPWNAPMDERCPHQILLNSNQ
jgi:hypothetical protein